MDLHIWSWVPNQTGRCIITRLKAIVGGGDRTQDFADKSRAIYHNTRPLQCNLLITWVGYELVVVEIFYNVAKPLQAE